MVVSDVFADLCMRFGMPSDVIKCMLRFIFLCRLIRLCCLVSESLLIQFLLAGLLCIAIFRF